MEPSRQGNKARRSEAAVFQSPLLFMYLSFSLFFGSNNLKQHLPTTYRSLMDGSMDESETQSWNMCWSNTKTASWARVQDPHLHLQFNGWLVEISSTPSSMALNRRKWLPAASHQPAPAPPHTNLTRRTSPSTVTALVQSSPPASLPSPPCPAPSEFSSPWASNVVMGRMTCTAGKGEMWDGVAWSRRFYRAGLTSGANSTWNESHVMCGRGGWRTHGCQSPFDSKDHGKKVEREGDDVPMDAEAHLMRHHKKL